MSGLFGSSLGTGGQTAGFGGPLGTNTGTQQVGGSIFGQSNQQNQSGGLFGGLNQPNQQQQPGSLFGQNQQQQSGGLFSGLNHQNTTQQKPGGIFGLSQNNQQSGGAFGGFAQSQQQNQTQGGIFGGSTQQQPQGGMFSQSTQQPLSQSQQGQLSTSVWQPNSGMNPRMLSNSNSSIILTNIQKGEKTVPDQIALVLEKWDTTSLNCSFQYYFYNKVDERMAPYYRPSPNEDPKAWEEALSKKPGPGYIPVLCTGFAQMGDRIKTQQRNLAEFNARLHEINNSLSAMLQNHDTKTSIRAMDAKRKHVVLKQRCLALATKVQVLRNRGYAMGGDEEDLKRKLQMLEKGVCDPGLGARAEEIWARMISVQERAKLLRGEIEKTGAESQDVLDEELSRRAKKVCASRMLSSRNSINLWQILEDYQTQLAHLKKEMDKIQEDYLEWEKGQGTLGQKVTGR